MAIIDGIQSSVIVNRKVAQEYRPPATDQNAANAPTESIVYIEGKDQAEFYFKVELPRNFKGKIDNTGRRGLSERKRRGMHYHSQAKS